MPALYCAAVSEFLKHEEAFIVGCQAGLTRTGISELTAEQLDAWRQQVTVLRSALRPFSDKNWHLLLEYSIPRRGKRIDAVLLAEGIVLVIEFKCGARKFDREAR